MAIVAILLRVALGSPTLPPLAVLDGQWVSDCTPLPKRHSVRARLDFHDGQVGVEMDLFADQQCRSLNLHASYSAKCARSPPAGDQRFGCSVGPAQMTLEDPEVVALYNADPKRGCGLQDWKLNAPRDVSGAVCSGHLLPQAGERIEDRFEITGGLLRFNKFPADGSVALVFRPSPADPKP